MSRESHGQTFMMIKNAKKTPQVHVRVRVREPIWTGSGKFRFFSGFPVSDSGSEWVGFFRPENEYRFGIPRNSENPGNSVPFYDADERSAETGNNN
jgi:hypothetical protein